MTINWRFDAAVGLLGGLGCFWLLSAPHFARQMAQGRFGPIRALHQDLAPTASARAWQAKNVGLGCVGALWCIAGFMRATGSATAGDWALAAALAIVVEQLAMPLLSPRHWKSYTGVLVGFGLAAAVLGSSGVAPW